MFGLVACLAVGVIVAPATAFALQWFSATVVKILALELIP